jgi:predicted kinase
MRLILVCGLPGSGKSFFAKKLSAELHAVCYNSDILRKELFPLKRTYSEEEKKLVYTTLLSFVEKELKEKHTVVIDATFYQNTLRIPFYKLAEQMNCPLSVIYLYADEKVVQERTSVTREDSEADYNVYLRLKNLFEPIDRPFISLTSERDNIHELIQSALIQLHV